MKKVLTLACIIFVSFSCGYKKQLAVTATEVSETPTRTTVETPELLSSRQIQNEYNNFNNDRTIYKNFEIENLENGLSISKNGKKLLFIKNQNGYEKPQKGKFELISLLGKDKELTYQTWTGGNHCCVYFSIVDLSMTKPRLIFSSMDYDVQGNLDLYNGLGTFDENENNRKGISQKITIYIPSILNNCAWISLPTVEVGFEYDDKIRKYIPSKKLTPLQNKWNKEGEQEINEANKKIKNGILPEMYFCEYTTVITSVVLSRIFTGNKKEADDFLEKNFLDYELEESDKVSFDPAKTKQTVKELKKEIEEAVVKEKLYRAVYKR